MPLFIIKTFGCKTNQYESEGIRESLLTQGWQESTRPEDAQVGIINTCSVTSRAGASARNALNKLRKANPTLRIILTGCAVDIAEDWIKQLDIEKYFCNTEKHLISLYLNGSQDYLSAPGQGFDFSISHFSGHTRAFIKIHDGCDNFCSYCIIPYARGKPRSRDPEAIVTEARKLIQNGYPELVLTGINIGAYNYQNYTLAELAARLSQLPGLIRLRLGSIEPIYLSDRLLEVMHNNPKICSHLHLPLQSGSDKILHDMNRKYTTKEYLKCIDRARERLDNPAISTDIIVGFPTETETEFTETVNTVEAAGFSRSHIFLFSPRSGTPAAALHRPPEREADRRRQQLEDITNQQALNYSQTLINFPAENLLVERIAANTAIGYLERYIRAELEFDTNTHIIKGTTYSIKIDRIKEHGKLTGSKPENTVVCSLNT